MAAATELFLRDGYAATSMEGVAAASGVSKRTLYKYHADKPALLKAAIASLVVSWRPSFDAEPTDAGHLSDTLLRLARRMLQVALSPQALALHRLAISEAQRFPEIVQALHQAGAASGIERIASLLLPLTGERDASWAAEQFQRLILAGPQQRALGFGACLDDQAQEQWARRSVALFLHGITSELPPPPAHNGIVS